MTAPRRIQRSRAKGWRMPAGAVYVGRPSQWGNPFVGPHGADRFRRWLEGTMPAEEIKLHMQWRFGPSLFALRCGTIGLLRGRDLACWCRLDQPCHADVLLEIANAPLRCEGVGYADPR